MKLEAKKKFNLFRNSTHFCSVPWNHIKVEADGSIKTCVHGEVILGNLASDSLHNIFTNDKIIKIRNNLFNDRPDYNCQSCVSHENSKDYKYLRNLYNPMFQNIDIDYSDDTMFELSGIDLHWSSICNLKCITCWAKQSSAIAQENGEPILHTTDEQAEKIINLIIDNQYNLKEIYLSGGEPTLIKHNIKLLQKLDKSINCIIRINTNMMFEQNNKVISELLKFKNVLVTISADSLNDQFNYIRRKADWNTFIRNLSYLRDSHFKFRLNSVFFVASALYLTETQEYFYDNFGIDDFTINQVGMGHTSIRCRNLPQSTKNKCVEKILKHQEKFNTNSNLKYQLNNCLKELENPKEEDYYDFFEEIDKKTKQNWKIIFPELI